MAARCPGSGSWATSGYVCRAYRSAADARLCLPVRAAPRGGGSRDRPP